MAPKNNLKNETQREILIGYRFHRLIIGTGRENIKNIGEKFKKVQITFLSDGKKSDKVYTLKGPISDVNKCYTFLEREDRKRSKEEESSDLSSEEDEPDEGTEEKSSKKNVRNEGKKKADVKFTQSTKQSSSQDSPRQPRLLLAVLFLIAALVAYSIWHEYFDFDKTNPHTNFCNPQKYNNCDEFLLQRFKDLGNKYNDQSVTSWLTLYSAARDHVSYRPNPQRPVVIMVYRLENSFRVTEILQDMAGVYESVLSPNRNYGNISIDGKSFMDSDPEETQKKIQKMFENGFEKEAKKVAIVHDFDKLPSCSVLTFHNYCNNDDAPHKNVAIILMVTAGDEKLSPDPSAPELEKAVSKLLHEKWKDCPKELPPGKIDAMLSRVANNVILLR